jgi:hypothetical protein
MGEKETQREANTLQGGLFLSLTAASALARYSFKKRHFSLRFFAN